ncbi:MAG: GAF domain-containing protein [Treponema sp.]|nr:GAF domain-containing protein [Treponema sp.]
MNKRNDGPVRTDDEPLYNSKIISTYLKLLKRRYPFVDASALLSGAGMAQHQAEDEGHWFTQSQVDLFYEGVVKATGEPGIAREAGRYSASPEGLGRFYHYVLGLSNPGKAFELIGKLAGGLTRSTLFEARSLGKKEIELVVTPREGVREKPYQCENRIGYFEAILSGFNSRKPGIEHPECIFKGGKACRYRISWENSASAVLRMIRLGLLASGVPILAVAAGYRGGAEFMETAAVLSSVLLALTLVKEQVEFRELNSVIEHQRLTTERSFEDFERVYNNALMGKEIGHVLSASTDIDAMLDKVMEILSQRGDYDRGIILLADEEKRNLVYRAGFGYTDELYREVRAARFSLFKPDSRGVFVLCYRERRPFLINDVSQIESDISPHSLEFLRRLGSKSFICCPILFEDQCLGVLAVDNLQSKRPLLESDINLLMGIAPEIGLTLNSAFFAVERERQFRSILRTLAASIDARDSLTAGHSERVTEYAIAICEEMNMPGEFTEVIRVAAQLHDYGKIGIKDSILKKSGPLTGKQREEIKTHVVKTQDILSRINFAGAYQQVPFIAGSHHERLDGTGYPRGLRGDEIPLGARILAVADFFEAITAKRHYHEPLRFEEAVETLKQEGGRHLDQTVIETLLRAIAKGRVSVPGAPAVPGGGPAPKETSRAPGAAIPPPAAVSGSELVAAGRMDRDLGSGIAEAVPL